jgi:hypothetical protein
MPSASAISLMRRIALGAAIILHNISNFPRKSSAPRKQHGTMPRTRRKPMRQFRPGSISARRPTSFFGQRGLNGTVDDRPGPFRYRSPKMVYVFDLLELSGR